MGRPKASLEVEGETFLQRAVNTLMAGGCADVVIVIDPDHPAGPERAFEGGVRSAAGSGSGSEQIDSLRSGLRATSASAEAAVVMPVDHPLVRPETVAALIAAFAEGGGEALIVRPTFQGKHGHPVLFSAALFGELLHGAAPEGAEGAEGARSVVRSHAGAVSDVEVDDGGVLIDVDTPEEYERWLGGGGRGRGGGGA